jgi:uncharacterized membrane protein YkvA (DUF1232 family)
LTPADSKFLPTFSGWLSGMAAEVQALGRILEAPGSSEPLRRASAEGLNYVLRSFDLIPDGLEALGYLDDLFAIRALAQRASQTEPEPVVAERESADDETEGSEAGGWSVRTSEAADEEEEDGSALVDGSSEQASANSELDGGSVRASGSSAGASWNSGDEAGTLTRLAEEANVVAEFLGDDFALLEQLVFSPSATEAKGRSVEDLLQDADLRVAALTEIRAWAQGYQPPELAAGEEELVKLRSFFGTKLRRKGSAEAAVSGP